MKRGRKNKENWLRKILSLVVLDRVAGVVSFLYVASLLIEQQLPNNPYVELFKRNVGRWNDIVGMLGIMVFIIGSVTVLIRRQTALLQSAKQSVDRLREVIVPLLDNVTKVFESLIDADLFPSVSQGSDRQIKLVSQGLKSVSVNLKAWANLRHGWADDLYLERVWLNNLQTYFREEAFDTKRAEIVTNARNYPFLLASTLLSFIEVANPPPPGKSPTVLFHAVTPIHPRDWYNWPHGRDKPRAHYECDFMRLYRGLLQEIAKEYKDKVEIVRYVLSADKDVVRKCFSWPLPNFGNAYDNLENWRVLDIPVPFRTLQQKVPRLG